MNILKSGLLNLLSDIDLINELNQVRAEILKSIGNTMDFNEDDSNDIKSKKSVNKENILVIGQLEYLLNKNLGFNSKTIKDFINFYDICKNKNYNLIRLGFSTGSDAHIRIDLTLNEKDDFIYFDFSDKGILCNFCNIKTETLGDVTEAITKIKECLT